MRLLSILLIFGLVIAGSSQVEAAAARGKKPRATKAAKPKKATSNLNTSHNFDDHGVTGEYQMPDEALAKVENEKTLTDLLGVRKHFKDRLAEASEQE